MSNGARNIDDAISRAMNAQQAAQGGLIIERKSRYRCPRCGNQPGMGAMPVQLHGKLYPPNTLPAAQLVQLGPNDRLTVHCLTCFQAALNLRDATFIRENVPELENMDEIGGEEPDAASVLPDSE